MIDTSSVTPGHGASDDVLISSDYPTLIDDDLASPIGVSILIDLSVSFVNLTLLLSEFGVLIALFSSLGCYSASLSASDSDSLS